jgi:hypothetical protein
MRKLGRIAAAGVMLAALGGAGLTTAAPASAQSYYVIELYHQAGFVADFCLHSQSYDNHNDHHASCSGDKGFDWWGRLAVPVTNRHRAWLDVWVRAGASATQITLHNGYQERLGRHVFDTKECSIYGTTFNWELICGREVFYKQ